MALRKELVWLSFLGVLLHAQMSLAYTDPDQCEWPNLQQLRSIRAQSVGQQRGAAPDNSLLW